MISRIDPARRFEPGETLVFLDELQEYPEIATSLKFFNEEFDTRYKLYFFDTGLFVAMLDEEAQEDLRANRNLGVYKGALYENIVAEVMHKCGYDLYYYKKEDSTLEEDFFVRTQKHLIPLEVKARRGTAKSLRTLIQSEAYPDIPWGIKLIAGNIGYSHQIYTFPHFCIFLLKEYLRSR